MPNIHYGSLIKAIFSLFLIIAAAVSAEAQWKGLTGIADTSFTVSGTYSRMKKEFPDIRIPSSGIPSDVDVKRDLEYTRVDGRPLKLDVFFPKEMKKAHPAVLLIFGGGWRSGDRSQLVPNAIELAKNGYVAVTAEYRLSTHALYPAAVLDLKKAIIWMRLNAKDFGIDTSKIATLGFSAGGQLAALTGITSGVSKFDVRKSTSEPSDAVQAIVDVDGLLAFIHPESGEGDDSKSISAATNWFGGNKVQMPERWQEASPLNYVSKNSPPILFLNSSVNRMHAGRDDMIAGLNKFGIYSEVHTFEGAPHVFPLFHPWFEPTMTYTVKFLNKVFGMNPEEK